MPSEVTGGGAPVTLPSYQPWAGDPDALDLIVARLHNRESHAEEIRVGLSALLSDPSLGQWVGQSATAFHTTLDPVPGLLGQMIGAYSRAADALSRYSHQIREGQAAFAKTAADLQHSVDVNPANAGGRGGALAHLEGAKGDAVDAHNKARSACAREVDAAEVDLHHVQTILADPRFSDFNAAFTKAGGNLADLAGLSAAGDALYEGDISALTAAMNGAPGAMDSTELRAMMEDLIGRNGGNRDFWIAFGPLLGRTPAYLKQHDALPDGSLPPADQAFLENLGNSTATAASAGFISFLPETVDVAGLQGLAALIAASHNGFGDGAGAQFLADLVTRVTDTSTHPPAGIGGDPNDAAANAALSAILKAAADNGTAARLALSGPGGLQLATQLLEGSAPVTTMQGTLGGSYTSDPKALFTDPGAIAAFLNAGIGQTLRGNDPASQQYATAAFNVVKAVNAFHGWNPSNDQMSVDVGGLPRPVIQSLIGYANAYTFDLAQSVAGTKDPVADGVVTKSGVPGNPWTFRVAVPEAQTFLNIALQDPKDAMAYQNLVAQPAFRNAVAAALQGGNPADFTAPYGGLVQATQAAIDNDHITSAQQTDATNANHLLILNSLLGAFGNAPSGTHVGLYQAADGLMQPILTGGPDALGGYFDTSHAAQAQAAAVSDHQTLGDQADLLVTQAALDSGALKASDLGPGAVDANGHVIQGKEFQAWWTNGQRQPLGPAGRSLDDYSNQIRKSMGLGPTS